ncbi:MAG TPA: hypothetical protein VKB37_03070, partial [Jatrophihabitantaceae bacterium]|nr:hypothetical protein [Jatrophihabitantaceae bacterium]
MTPDCIVTASTNPPALTGARGAVLVGGRVLRDAPLVAGDGRVRVGCCRAWVVPGAAELCGLPIAAGLVELGGVTGSTHRSAVVHAATPSVTAPTTAAPTTTLRVISTASQYLDGSRARTAEHHDGETDQDLPQRETATGRQITGLPGPR